VTLAPILFWIHVAAAFAFVLAHGVSVFVSLRLRGERDTARLGALLDLSYFAVRIATLMLLVVVVSGVIASFVGDLWGRGWVWASLGILVVLWGWMSARGVLYFDAIRHALGKRGVYDGRTKPDPDPAPGQLEGLLSSSRPYELVVVGLVGLAAIIWLMIAKPF
jgi:cytochrome c biogenesis protein CcdA